MDPSDTQEHDGPYTHKDLKLPSKFNPPMPNMLNHIHQLFVDKLLEYNPKPVVKNLSNSEWFALLVRKT